MMRFFLMVIVSIFIGMNPAIAQHFSPSETDFLMQGSATVESFPCYLDLNFRTGTDLGGAHGGHADDSIIIDGVFWSHYYPQCSALGLESGDVELYQFDQYGGSAGMGSATGVLKNVVINYFGVPTCWGGALNFYSENVSLYQAKVEFNGYVGSCSISAMLLADDLQVVP